MLAQFQHPGTSLFQHPDTCVHPTPDVTTLVTESPIEIYRLSRVNANNIPPSNIIGETLTLVTDVEARKRAKERSALLQALKGPLSNTITDAELRKHPLAAWVETNLGVTFSDLEQRWVRAKPRTLTEAVEKLSVDSAAESAECDRAQNC